MPDINFLESFFNSTQEQQEGPIYLRDLHREQEEQQRGGL